MPRINQDITFEGGINFDTNLKNIPKGDYRYMLNMRNTRTTNGNWGGVVNIKGNVLVPYQLPSGNNEVIGRLENKKDRSIDYFVWNENGEHRILTYYFDSNTIQEVIVGSKLGFNRDWRINQKSIIDSKYLLYTDNVESGDTINGNPLRYIDKTRAYLFDKNVEMKSIVSNKDFNKVGVVYKVKIYYKGNLVADKQVWQNTTDNINNKEILYSNLSNAINADTVISNYLVADDCGGCKLHIRFKNKGDYWFELYSTTDTFYNIPENRYHKDWDEYSINLGKRPPLYSPTLKLRVDDNFGFNYIDGYFFQFAIRYTYWDGQQSTTSPFSEIGSSPLKCSSKTSPYNVIDVYFGDEILKQEKYLSDIKYVEILVREGNSGHFKSVEKIDVCDIVLPDMFYTFKNDGSYSVINDDDAYRPYDYIPLNALGFETVDDRNYLANTKENYDNLDCLDAKIDVTYKEVAECDTEYVTIKGKVKIINTFKIEHNVGTIRNDYVYKWQPIWSTNGEKFYFGGTGNKKNTGLNLPSETDCASMKQEIPMGGFVMYLAGTSYYAVSVQKPIMGTIAGSETNVYKIDTLGDLKDYINNAENECYGTFEIKNVPKGGKYLLRVASNLVSPDDRYGSVHNINNGIEWQRTSTYLLKANGQNGHEVEIDTNVVGDTIELNDFFEINDFTTNNIGHSSCLAGYLIDGIIEQGDNGSRIELLKKGFSAERVIFSHSGGVHSYRYKTDHNGFFFVGKYKKLPNHGGINDGWFMYKDALYQYDFRKKDESAYKGMLGELYSGGLSSVNEVDGSTDKMEFYIVYNHYDEVRRCKRTYLEGTILDQYGEGVSGITIVSSNTGRVVTSSSSGKFRYVIYASTHMEVANERLGKLYLITKDGCCPKISVNAYSYEVGLYRCAGVGDLRETYVINIDAVTVNTEVNGVWKHRNNVKLGIKYYDDYGRSTKVQTDDNKLKAYIPFWTEINGNKGLPIVSWEINHLPPTWAKNYQIVRVKNQIYNKFLQTFIADVKYVKSYGQTVVETTYEGGDATEIYFALQVLVDYQNENSGSVLSWEFTKGDRITLMKDANGDWFDSYYDFRVENDRLDTLLNSTSLVIKNDTNIPKLEKGIMIEIWNPKNESTQETFYEMSECYPIENGFHKGGYNGQDQTSTQPAKGTIKIGDAYLVNRQMPIIEYGAFTPPNPPPIDTKEYRGDKFETEYMRENLSESRVQNIGRIDIEDKDYKQIVFINRVRFSGRYIPETNINQLNRFAYTDYVKDNLNSEIDRMFGGVMVLAYTGNVLLAVCKNKTVPIYINATQTYEVDGSGGQIMRSSRIANLALPIKEDRGTQNAESVFVENGELYAFDISKGVYWRYQYSGIFDISDYDANTYFANVSKQLLTSTDKRVISSYDRDNDELVVSIPALQETISFNNVFRGEVRKNRWMTFYSYLPENMCPVQRGFVSFKNGALWVHNSNEERCSFYGQRYECGIDVVVNDNPLMKKIFWKIKEITNSLFYTQKKGIEVYGLRTDKLQISQLSTQHFEQQEGDWRADFRRNMSDTYFNNITDLNEREITALVRGEVLKGNTMLIKLRNFDEKEVILYSVNIEMSDSQTTIK